MTGRPNDIIHQSMRLRIMAALDEDKGGEGLPFARLKAILGATDGNLGAHLATLEKAGYIEVTKAPPEARPRTTVTITPEGRNAFAGHVAFLRGILGSHAPLD